MWFSKLSASSLVVLLALAALMAVRGFAQSPSLPVVPGIAGFGTTTRAAYGAGGAPTVYRVTNLNDSGTGSLRAALTAPGPRVVIFEISGNIDLASIITVTNPYLTVAGQTAPSPGITVRYYGIESQTHDVLFQHFRIRPGWTGVNCNSGLDTWRGTYNNVYDHMSMSWQQDEGYAWQASNSTLWRSISAEALAFPPGSGSCGGGGAAAGHGALVTDGAWGISLIQNLFATNATRNPEMHPGGNAPNGTYFSNNVVYDFQEPSILNDPNGSGLPAFASHIGNYYKTGPNTPSGDVISASRYLITGSQWYIKDEVKDYTGNPLADFVVINGDGIDPRVGSPPFAAPTGYVPLSGAATYASVLANVGARPLDRDAVDTRIIANVTNRTAHSGFVVTQADVGGWPTLAANRRTLTLPSSPHSVTPSGYTNLEVWLQGFSAAVGGGGGGELPPPAPVGLHLMR